MFFPAELGPQFMKIIKPLWESDDPDALKLQRIWSMLTGLQGIVVGQVLTRRIGTRVFAGPFRGMELIRDIMDRNFTPSLLGTYEWEIHDAVENAIGKNYKQIINVGCSYGYYAVGFAMRCPNTTVFAYDIDPDARANCKKMAELNGVENRVIIGERFGGEDYERFADSQTLVFMDVESAEDELLDPQRFPALKGMDIIVELHDVYKPGLSTSIPLRFVETHTVRVVPNAPFSFPLDKVLGPDYKPDHFDNLIATWEGRGGPTPFGVFTRK